MKHLPPTGWGDVATTRDLDQLEARLEARFDARLATFQATMLKWMLTTTLGSMIALAGLVAAITTSAN